MRFRLLFFLCLSIMFFSVLQGSYNDIDLLIIQSKHLQTIERLNIPLFDRMNDFLLIGILKEEYELLNKNSVDYKVADRNIGDKTFYIINTLRSDILSSLRSGDNILFQDNNEILLRISEKQVRELTAERIDIRRVFLVPKPYGPHHTYHEHKVHTIFDPVVNQIIYSISIEDLHEYCGSLSGEWPVMIGGELYTITSRHSYYAEGIEKATQYTYEFFSNLGLDVEYHYFSGPGGRNVIAKQTGLIHPDSYFMICAHIDTLPAGAVSPGADDNASGSTAVMVAAELFSEYLFDYSIIYALWTGEEQGLIGSGYFAQEAAASGKDIIGVINLDMIAWESNGDPVIQIHAKQNQLPYSMVLANTMAEIIDIYGLNLVPYILPNGLSYSDHASFWNYGYSAILGIEDYYNDFNPYYHTVNDLLIHLNMPYFLDFTRAAIATMAHLSGIRSNTSDGIVYLCRGIYSCNSNMEINVIDSDLQGQDFATVSLSHDQDPGGIIVELLPQDNPYHFSGNIVFGDDYSVEHGNVITVYYIDRDTGDGSSSIKTVQADIDCIGPEITGINVSEISGSSVNLSFVTSKPSLYWISYGIIFDELDQNTDISDIWSTEHDVIVPGLETNTLYFFRINAIDKAGNITESPCLFFKTSKSIVIGDGNVVLEKAPLYTFYHDNRTQVIYTAFELGNEQNILTGLSLNVTSLPGRQLNNWTIRLKHTNRDDYETNPGFENTGWTVVYQNDENIIQLGNNYFPFDTVFTYDGVNNLMLDLSFNNSTWTMGYGKCYWTPSNVKKTVYAYSDSWDGDPLNWAGSSVSNFNTTQNILNIEFSLYEEQVPNFVELDFFTAIGTEDLIDISWQTQAEINLVGWNVYRQIAEKTGPFLSFPKTKLNHDLIISHGDVSQGFLYQYSDTVGPGDLYLYYLEAVFTDGSSELWQTMVLWE